MQRSKKKNVSSFSLSNSTLVPSLAAMPMLYFPLIICAAAGQWLLARPTISRFASFQPEMVPSYAALVYSAVEMVPDHL